MDNTGQGIVTASGRIARHFKRGRPVDESDCAGQRVSRTWSRQQRNAAAENSSADHTNPSAFCRPSRWKRPQTT